MEQPKSFKIGVSYNLFDGEELLEASIKAIREHVYYINVVYQTISNLGNPASPDLVEKLEAMRKEGLIDELYLYTPILEAHPRYNETNKRDIGFELVKNDGCDYFLGMDVDEFYDGQQLELAAKHMVLNDITTSAVSIIRYYKHPEYQVFGIHNCMEPGDTLFNYYVPFLVKIDRSIIQKHGTDYFPCFTDPTRGISCPGRFRVFCVQDIAMHHMSTIRKDLVKKLQNTSETIYSKGSLEAIKEIEKSILDFDFDKFKEVPKDFAIDGANLYRKVENKFNIDVNSLSTNSVY